VISASVTPPRPARHPFRPTVEQPRAPRATRWLWAAVFAATAAASASAVYGQIQYSRGQNIAPSFDGWMPNADGSFDLLFGYMNRNFEEHLFIPVGAANMLEPGKPDQGQPTYFFPRRNMHVFRVTVPKDFGKKELVWTITSNGKTEKAYALLKPEFILDARGVYRQYTGFDVQGKVENNQPPVIRVEGALQRTAAVGQPLLLSATASDDGIPEPARGRGGPFQGTALGLRVAWHVYRGPGDAVSFDPEQFKVYPDFFNGSPWTPGWSAPKPPADGRYPVRVTFSTAGTFVVRALAHDGGADSYQDVTVVVTPNASASAGASPR
jgi:hypothetical protein